MSTQQKTLQEKDILQDLLNTHKDITKLYAYSLIESSCPNMRKLLLQNLQKSAEDQFAIFEVMNKKGYYPTEKAEAQKVSQAVTQFGQIKKSLCSK